MKKPELYRMDVAFQNLLKEKKGSLLFILYDFSSDFHREVFVIQMR